MKIRSDLIGVVILTTTEGTTITLNPGDEVPEVVVVGDHLTAEPGPESDDAGDDAANEAPAGAADDSPGDEVPEGIVVGEVTPKPRTRRK